LEVQPRFDEGGVSIAQTLLPFLAASFVSAVAFYAILTIRGEGSRAMVEGILGIFVFAFIAFVSALVLVLPVMIFIPRLRRPPPLVAAPWGAAVACLVPTVLAGGIFARGTYAYFGVMGVTAGIVYAFSVRFRQSAK